jgi:cob(I)alamin adenosyltransferase
LGAILATESESAKKRLPLIYQTDIEYLEKAIDKMESTLDPIKTFVLPGGHPTVSYCHISRCVCRRAERLTVELAEDCEIESLVIQYLNRLSDYLFVLSRFLTKSLNATEIPWIPEK